MTMSAKSRAILAAEQKNEWNWFMKDFAKARNQYNLDLADAQDESESRSGWQKAIGTIAFIGSVAWFLAGEKASGMEAMKASAYAAGIGTTAGTVAQGLWAEGQNLRYDDINLLPEEYTKDIHKPRYGKGQADVQMTEFEGKVEQDVATLDDWYDDAWSNALYENVGRGSSFFGSTSGSWRG